MSTDPRADQARRVAEASTVEAEREAEQRRIYRAQAEQQREEESARMNALLEGQRLPRRSGPEPRQASGPVKSAASKHAAAVLGEVSEYDRAIAESVAMVNAFGPPPERVNKMPGRPPLQWEVDEIARRRRERFGDEDDVA